MRTTATASTIFSTCPMPASLDGRQRCGHCCGCKRKSDPKIDEVEDGGRAIVIEEGIAAMVFSYAERRNFLEGAEGVNYELLRTIKDMTSHLEVSCRTEGDWERAIMTGFRIWRQVRAKGKGHLMADLEKGTVELAG